MENIETNNVATDSNFPLKGYAKGLIWAGFIGLILTVIFWFYGKGLANDGMSGTIFEHYIPTLVIYYTINSLLVLLSGVLLVHRKKIGIFAFIIVCLSVFGSLYIADSGTNLFLWTVVSSLWAIQTGAPIGVLFFLGTIIANLAKIRLWFKIL